MKTPAQIARQCSTRYAAGIWHCPATGDKAGTADQHPVQVRYVSPGYWQARVWRDADWHAVAGNSMRATLDKLAAAKPQEMTK